MVQVTNFFTDEQALEYQSLASIAHMELEEKFADLLKLDRFPALMCYTEFDSSNPKQRLAELLLTPRVNRNRKIEAVETNDIDLHLVSAYSYMVTLGLHKLDQMKFQIVFKDFISQLLIYNLIKAHDIKYVYDRFVGESIEKQPHDILSDMIEKENNMHYFNAVENFYKDKWKENKIGYIFATMNFSFVKYLQSHQTIKGMLTDPIIRKKVQDIKDEVNFIFSSPDKIVLQ